MMTHCSPFSPENWMTNVLSARVLSSGQTIRRKLRHIDCLVGRDRFLSEVKRRGWHAVEQGEHLVVFCNPQPVKVIL